MNQALTNFLYHSKRLFHVYLTGLFIFLIARIVFFIRLEKKEDIGQYTNDLFKAFWVGAKFDTMVLLYGMLVPLALAFFSLFIKSSRYQVFVSTSTRYFMLLVLILYSIIMVIDIYYYDYFQSHINILFFGFFEDDTTAVMKSVWTDYPLIRVVIFMVLLIWFINYLLKKIFTKKETAESLPSTRGAFMMVILVLGLFFIGMRGSLGTFPLQIDDATISQNSTINLLPMNGVFSLKEAWLTRKKQMNMDGNIEWLKKIGYESQAKAAFDYFGLSVSATIREKYFKRTVVNEFRKKNPPHVILFMMESMSNYNLNFHSEQLNLLGSLEKYWKSEILFRKCLPFGNGTINTLEGLMVNTPVTSLAQSANRFVHFGSSVALPFKAAGYHTVYVTGGKLGWRNINEFIPNQGFEQVDGNANIQQAIPSATQCEWGVYDEYLFDYVFKQLQQSNGTPQMIFAMSTTNHTPFNLPPHYKPYEINIPGPVKSKLLTDEDMARKNFTNLQYSNDCLGKFLDKLKSSPFGENTIVAATGDHNNLMLFDFTDYQVLEKRGVPLLFYVPKTYLQDGVVDTSLFVSHKDIFPTLINLALSDASYFNGGNFLFDSGLKKENFFSIDLMSKESVNYSGAVQFDPQPVLYAWNETMNTLVKTTQLTPGLDSLMIKSRAYYAAMSYFIKTEIDGQKKPN